MEFVFSWAWEWGEENRENVRRVFSVIRNLVSWLGFAPCSEREREQTVRSCCPESRSPPRCHLCFDVFILLQKVMKRCWSTPLEDNAPVAPSAFAQCTERVFWFSEASMAYRELPNKCSQQQAREERLDTVSFSNLVLIQTHTSLICFSGNKFRFSQNARVAFYTMKAYSEGVKLHKGQRNYTYPICLFV